MRSRFNIVLSASPMCLAANSLFLNTSRLGIDSILILGSQFVVLVHVDFHDFRVGVSRANSSSTGQAPCTGRTIGIKIDQYGNG